MDFVRLSPKFVFWMHGARYCTACMVLNYGRKTYLRVVTLAQVPHTFPSKSHSTQEEWSCASE